MPDGRGYAPNKRLVRRNGKYYKRNYRKVAVPSKPKSTIQKRYIRNNAKAINSVAKSVARLKKTQHGALQMSIQNTGECLKPTAGYPCIVMVDTPDSNRSFTVTELDGTVKTCTSAGTAVRQWNPTTSSTKAITNFTNETGKFANNPLWADIQQSIPDTGKIFLESIKYQISMDVLVQAEWVRFDLIRPKPALHKPFGGPLNTETRILPDAVKWMGGMSNPGGNALPRNQFYTYWTKRFYFDTLSQGDGRTKGRATGGSMKRHFNFTIRPNKVIHAYNPRPINPSDLEITTMPPSAAGTLQAIKVPYQDGPFGAYNRHIGAGVWLVISTSLGRNAEFDENFDYVDQGHLDQDEIAAEIQSEDPDAVAPYVCVNMTRTVRWRDHQGGMYTS